jgi:hypothetical protein
MNGVFPILLIVVIAVIAIVAGYYSYLAQQKRREELSNLANEIGWSFDPDRDVSHDEEYADFEMFRRGHSRAAYNTLAGSLTIDDRTYPAKMGDFTYKITSSNGKSTTTRTYHFSYLIVHLPFPATPDLLIRREGLFDKVAGFFGFDDIDFESEEFSRKFCVKSPDKKFAYDVIHPRMMEFLLQSAPTAIDIERGCCCLSDGSRRWEPVQFKAMLTWIDKFFDQWPDHLTAQLDT